MEKVECSRTIKAINRKLTPKCRQEFGFEWIGDESVKKYKVDENNGDGVEPFDWWFEFEDA